MLRASAGRQRQRLLPPGPRRPVLRLLPPGPCCPVLWLLPPGPCRPVLRLLPPSSHTCAPARPCSSGQVVLRPQGLLLEVPVLEGLAP